MAWPPAVLAKLLSTYAAEGGGAVLSRVFSKMQWTVAAPFASLHATGEHTGTDKVHPFPVARDLSYLNLKVYDQHLRHRRRERLHILEIGVLYGQSLQMWKSYCPNAQVFGLDIDPACKRFSDARTTITIGSQSDPVALEAVVREAGGFDVIIDDGSHVNHHIIASFKRLWPHLRLGGLYAIEDLASSYAPLEDDNIRQQWPGMAYNRADDNLNNRREELDAFFNHLLHDLDHDRGHVLSVQFWPYLCLILKTQVSGEPSAATF